MAKGISETAFASQVEDLLNIGSWKWMHIKPSIMQSGRWASSMNEGGKGWLDYLALRPPRVLIFELKDDRTKMTPEQEEWWEFWELCKQENSNLELYLWRPRWIDEVVECLR